MHLCTCSSHDVIFDRNYVAIPCFTCIFVSSCVKVSENQPLLKGSVMHVTFVPLNLKFLAMTDEKPDRRSRHVNMQY